MHAGTIFWNGADLTGIGKAKLGIRRQPDPPAPGQATRMLVDLTVTVELEAMDPGTIQARAQWLADGMRVAEGILRCASGSGHALEWLAVPGANNLEQALSGLTNTVELSFSAVENHASLTGLTGATFTPPGGAPLHLHAARDLKEEIRTARHAERNSARSLTTTTLAFTARVAQANAADSHATRLAWLQTQAAAVKALDTREGTLVLGLTNAIVRVTEFSPVIDERLGALDVQVQCQYLTLPDAGTAECAYEIDTKIDEGSGEEVISFKGEIAAESRDIALAKLSSLRTAQLAISGQRVTSYGSTDKVIDGADTAASGNDWTGALSFTLEVRKARSGVHHTLRISTQKDIRSGMKWSYSGTIQGADEAAALAAARAIAAAQNHPVMTRSDETIERVTQIDNPEILRPVKVDFSYEFEGPSDGFIGGEITIESGTPLVGEWRRSTSGFLIAATKEAAEARLALLLAGDANPLETTRKWSEVYHDATGADATPKRVAMRLDFTSSLRITRTRAAVEFTDSTQNSISAMRQTRTLSGTLWSDTEANADSALSAFLISLLGSAGAQETTRTHAKLSYPAGSGTASVTGASQWVKLDFSASNVSRLTGVTGYDLLEASMTMSRDGALDATIVTPIPFGRPVAQPNTGYIPGRITIAATAKAINLNTARSWVQGKRALVAAIGTGGSTRHETDQPRETAAPDYAPFNGTTAAAWSFSGNYGWTFTGTEMDGVWTTGLPT